MAQHVSLIQLAGPESTSAVGAEEAGHHCPAAASRQRRFEGSEGDVRFSVPPVSA
jgi:hypothetical protein